MSDPQSDLFGAEESATMIIAPQVLLLRQRAAPTALLQAEIRGIAALAPFRHLRTRGGGQMSVAMTNCGKWGWHSDERGYRYVDRDPDSSRPWPAMPALFHQLAQAAAAEAGFGGFDPDACLVNRYSIGAQMGAHRDHDEHDMAHPIVSVSIGLPATFLWYGEKRSARPVRVPVADGDVIVWGGAARAGYHAVKRLDPPRHRRDDFTDESVRYNLTFRRAR
jgi:alkylated DNA repair protein (DNA oxidative demethylase)